jgi:N-acetyl-anhydromuramyl-L-alanine amidase AmpD
MIRIDGMRVPVTPRWHDGAVLRPDGWCTRTRTDPPDLIVLHWTGGEGGATQVAKTLGARGLSVHFFVDRSGVVWQYEDPVHTTTLHAGAANSRSIGIEIANYAWRPAGTDPPAIGRDRAMTSCRIHGWSLQHAQFYPEQVTATIALCDILTARIRTIPRHVHHTSTAVDLDVLTGGVIGHYHVSRRKIDPGTRILKMLDTHWGGE